MRGGDCSACRPRPVLPFGAGWAAPHPAMRCAHRVPVSRPVAAGLPAQVGQEIIGSRIALNSRQAARRIAAKDVRQGRPACQMRPTSGCSRPPTAPPVKVFGALG